MDAQKRQRVRRRLKAWAQRCIDAGVEPVMLFSVAGDGAVVEGEVTWIDPIVNQELLVRVLRGMADQVEREQGTLIV